MIDQIKANAVAIGAGLAIIFFISLGWVGRMLYDNATERAMREAQAVATQAAASEIAKLSAQSDEAKGKVAREIIREVRYKECVHTPEAFNQIQEAFK